MYGAAEPKKGCLQTVEDNLWENIESVIDSGSFEFSSLNAHCNNNPKLSLVFNSYGMERTFIQQTADIDGYALDSEEIGDMDHVKDVVMKQNLAWCTMLLGEQISDISAHKKRCAVCAHDTPNKLAELLHEHDLERIHQFQLNGPRALVVSTTDFIVHYKSSPAQTKRFMETVKQLRKIHYQED